MSTGPEAFLALRNHFTTSHAVLCIGHWVLGIGDRHLNNFGAVRDAETLEWHGMAPIYDSGSSLGYDKVAPEIRAEQDIECKPFKKHHEEQLKLVTDFSWIDFKNSVFHRILNLSEHIIAITVNDLDKLTDFTSGIC